MCACACVSGGIRYSVHVDVKANFQFSFSIVGSADQIQVIRFAWQALLPAESSHWPYRIFLYLIHASIWKYVDEVNLPSSPASLN